MRFLVDAQLPPAFAVFLTERGHDALAVRDVGLREASDVEIWAYADANDMVIVSKDEDFAHRALATNSGPGVVWIRVGNVTTAKLFDWFEPLLPAVVAMLGSGERLVEAR